MKAPAIRLAVALCSVGAALPASAADIRSQLTPDLIYTHCRAAGAGSEIEGTFMLPSGRVTGTVPCTAADLVAPTPGQSVERGEDDDDDDEHEDEDDNAQNEND